MSGIGPAMDTGLDASAVLASGSAVAAPQPVTGAAHATQPVTAQPAPRAVGTPAPVGAGAAPATATSQPADASATAVPATDTATGTSQASTPVAGIAGRPRTATATTLKTAGHHPAMGQPPSAAGSLGGTVFALFLVIGLILALGWLAKRMPGMARGGSNNGLRLVASLPVGARERVVVVDVGGTQLLLGVGAGGTRTLHTLEQPLPVDAGPATPQFAQLLAQHFGKKA